VNEMTDTCPQCGSLLRIGTSYMTFENDTTPDLPTIAYTNLPMICLNHACAIYGGEDVSNPKYVVEIVKNRVN
jgi:hypothetical protein